jgi:small subunit ribosomal protein S20
MPHHKAQWKSWRQNIKKNNINTGLRSGLKTAIKKVDEAILKKDVATAQKLYLEAQVLIDKAGQKNLIDPNKASRNKSRLMRQINAIKTA